MSKPSHKYSVRSLYLNIKLLNYIVSGFTDYIAYQHASSISHNIIYPILHVVFPISSVNYIIIAARALRVEDLFSLCIADPKKTLEAITWEKANLCLLTISNGVHDLTPE